MIASQASETPTGRRRMITRTDSPIRISRSVTNAAIVIQVAVSIVRRIPGARSRFRIVARHDWSNP